MSIKVYISPTYSPKDTETGGIRRVVDAMARYLPEFGIEVVRHPSQADIINNHGAMLTHLPGVPIVHTGHGLYWSRQPWGSNFQQVNAQVVRSMQLATAHTVPSEWVNRAVRRGGFWYPEVIYHGVEPDEFKPGENGGYVLWNKARADYVSDPGDMQKVAQMVRGVNFKTTIGHTTSNVEVVGTTTYEEMKSLVANAGVYLCTVRETFGIGTLEAMACGVPIVGWDWGGQSEIIRNGQTGYLVHPGDYTALVDAIQRALSERERLGANARQDVLERWLWKPRIQQYADIFQQVYENRHLHEKPRVSVIVTAYKLDQFLPDCLNSVMAQTYKNFECLVVDDVPQESTRIVVDSFAEKDKRIRYIPVPFNLGLPGARNFGFNRAKGEYIRHLDADDFLAPNALELEVVALDNDPSTHIAYGHLEVTNPDGSRILGKDKQPVRSNWPPKDFDWIEQMAHLNQLPSCAMMRREVLERTGGYRSRMLRNEDAEFWCRATSLGFRAKKFTQAVTYFHRQREDSKGAIEWREEGSEPDWTAWFPWRIGSTDYKEAVAEMRKNGGQHPRAYSVPFGAQGKAPDGLSFWYVHDYAYPVVSIIVTCGPDHEPYLVDALDSIQAQTYPDWECVVVNDTGKKWDKDIMGAPWAQVINMDGNQGAAAARNAGLGHTRGKYIVWMDADDYWLPWFLEKMVVYADFNDGIIYSDLIKDLGDKLEIYRYAEFDQSLVEKSMRYPGSSVLIPQKIAKRMLELQGGWDEKIPGMEDWDYQIAMHAAGYCAYHIPEALFVYRMYSSTKRESDYAKIEKIKTYIDEKWFRYRKGSEKMSCGCGSKQTVKTKPGSTLSSSGNFPQSQAIAGEVSNAQMVNVEYVGPIAETFSIRSKVDRGITYRFGNNSHHKLRAVFMQDAEYLNGLHDGNDQPLYRIIGTGSTMENNDPTAFLGRPLQAATD